MEWYRMAMGGSNEASVDEFLVRKGLTSEERGKYADLITECTSLQKRIRAAGERGIPAAEGCEDLIEPLTKLKHAIQDLADRVSSLHLKILPDNRFARE